MKTLFSFLMALFICLCATAQQKAAFKEIGKKQKLYSLSNGHFDEQFLNEPVQQIGSVEIDVATRRIKRLLPADSMGSAGTDMIVATRFLSVDPLAKSYPELTPYQFASNKPINGTDLDGLEWVLSIHDPNAASKFDLAVNTWKDVYMARQIAYEAMNSKLSEDEFKNIVNAPNFKGIIYRGFGIYAYGESEKTMSSGMNRATLDYDKTAAEGLTVQMNMGSTLADGSYAFINSKQMQFAKNKGNGDNYTDIGYPVDVRTINSPEYTNFYDHDFKGQYSGASASLWVGSASNGSIWGYLKGSGFVSYNVDAIGVNTGGIFSGNSLSVATGTIWGDATNKNQFFTPSLLAGWGAQVSGGYSVGIGVEGGIWGSFQEKQNAINFDAKKATFTGGFAGGTFGLKARFKKPPVSSSGGTPPNLSVSNSTLLKPSN